MYLLSEFFFHQLPFLHAQRCFDLSIIDFYVLKIHKNYKYGLDQLPTIILIPKVLGLYS
jgi:hypothetical protein